jgi:hypothetical protein
MSTIEVTSVVVGTVDLTVFPAWHAERCSARKVAVMTTLEDVTKKKAEQSAEQQAAVELVRLAQEQGLSLTGPDGLLKQLTKTVLETALNEEMTEHLGYEKHDPAGAGTGNIRNGTRSKTVLTDTTGPVDIDVPRDRAATFEPQIVKKRRRRLSGADEVVLSLYAKGLTPQSASPSAGNATSSACGPAPAVRVPSSGRPCSPTYATAASRTPSSSSATA